MTGIYFSGTGNTRYCTEFLAKELDPAAACFSIEDPAAEKALRDGGLLIFGYPVYFSNLPGIAADFLEKNREAFKGKTVFLLATMGLFSGDGCGCAARTLRRYGAETAGGLHLKMPDCIGDVKLLKKTDLQNRELIRQAEEKMRQAARKIREGRPPRDGLGILHHIAGFLGQRAWFSGHARRYRDRLKISGSLCTGCGTCVSLCPMDNLFLDRGKAEQRGRCTLCYRCVSRCPEKALTLLGKEVYQQYRIEDFLRNI